MIKNVMFEIAHTRLAFSAHGLSLLSAYNEENRYYHNVWHINEMLHYVTQYESLMTPDEYRELQAAILFHDVVYNPKAKDNEERSVDVFLEAVNSILDPGVSKYWSDRTDKVAELIMETKNHEFSGDKPIANRTIILADLDRFNATSFEQFWGYTLQLFKEYSHVDFADFKAGRLAFLEQYADKLRSFMADQAVSNVKTLIPVLKTWHPTIAVYPGSFNPFHVGHKNILEKAEAIFDKVIIAVGNNKDKDQTERQPLPESITRAYQVDTYDGYLTDYVKSKSYPLTVIRGLRNSTDLQHELNQYRWMQELDSEIQMVSIFCDKDFEHVSSRAIKYFESYGKQSRHKVRE